MEPQTASWEPQVVSWEPLAVSLGPQVISWELQAVSLELFTSEDQGLSPSPVPSSFSLLKKVFLELVFQFLSLVLKISFQAAFLRVVLPV